MTRKQLEAKLIELRKQHELMVANVHRLSGAMAMIQQLLDETPTDTDSCKKEPDGGSSSP